MDGWMRGKQAPSAGTHRRFSTNLSHSSGIALFFFKVHLELNPYIKVIFGRNRNEGENEGRRRGSRAALRVRTAGEKKLNGFEK